MVSCTSRLVLLHCLQFSAMLRQGALRDMLCFYDSQKRKFHTVLQLGREVCGFPRIVHGGLTAAIMDETFGFLLFALKVGHCTLYACICLAHI